MNIKLWSGCLMLLGGVSLFCVPVSAASKSFELYSWPQTGSVNYCYAIVPSSKEPLPAAEIKAAKNQLCGGRDDLKRLLGQNVPLKSKVTWQSDPANGLTLPDRDIINDLGRFAQTMPYKLVIAEPQ